MSKKGRVLVAMSGGIDSSMVSIMLHEQGYEVIGVTMKTWDYSKEDIKKETGCCSLDSINDARSLSVYLGFTHFVLDIKKEFKNNVINNFIKEYALGKTPNPCIMCNTHIKWNVLLEKANKFNCEFIATGHYANIRLENKRFIISKGKDKKKDQSYVLWGISQKNLKRTIFPLGNFKKKEIYSFAKNMGFKNLSKKSESYEICFIPDNDYRKFLINNSKNLKKKVEKGKFFLKNGKMIGYHDGYPFYTIGQRKKLNISLGYPLYVLEIHPFQNKIILGQYSDLIKTTMYVNRLNMMKYLKLNNKTHINIKVRYNDLGTPAVIEQFGNEAKILFLKKINIISPGQSAVFYENEDVIGGGFIMSSCK